MKGLFYSLETFWKDLWRLAKNDKGALVGGAIVALYCVVALIGPYVERVSRVTNPADAYLPPSFSHPLGTGPLGQDILSQLVVGTRPIMEVGILAALITVTVGVVVGLVSGYLGGFADSALMRVTDVFLTIPGLALVIVIAGIVRNANPIVLAPILSMTAWAPLARAVRSQALSLRESDFVEAAKQQALPLRNMVGRQLLPNVGPYVAIHFMLAVTGAIYAEVGLFVLGVVPVSGTNWGIMIYLAMGQGALFTTKSMLSLFAPMVAIVILQVALVFFTRVLDAVFNPRLRVQ